MRTIFLYLLTNMAVLLVAGVVLNLIGYSLGDAYYADNMNALLVFCAIFGFGGSLISAMMSKWMAKNAMRVKVIENPASRTETWLMDNVRSLARDANIGMPEVGVFPSQSPNAFATGFNRNNALVAVSTGLLDRMNEHEVRAVLAHEVGHVANGDMVTLSLIQGVVNTFVMFFARVVGRMIDSAMNQGRNSRPGFGYFIIVMVLEMVFGVLASIIVCWFSRKREYRADAWGAKLAGRDSMVSALDTLRRGQAPVADMPEHMQAFGIRGPLKGKLGELLATHPPLEDRIRALQENRVQA